MHAQEHRSNRDGTSDALFMTQIQDAAGKIFDTDSPGAEFQELDRAGARHRWQFEARQFVAMGPRPSYDAVAASDNLRSRISPYRSRFVATVTRADGVSPPTVIWAADGTPVLVEGAEEGDRRQKVQQQQCVILIVAELCIPIPNRRGE